MALQKADIQRFEWLKSQVERLGIRFPVAEIAEKTGFDQGNISSYLKGKKPISDNFITSFKEAYKVEGPSSDQDFTANQLFAMFLEVSKAQTVILGDIRKEMARQDTLAIIEEKIDLLQKFSSENLWNGLMWVANHQDADRQTQFHSLARLEAKALDVKIDEDFLLRESNKKIVDLARLRILLSKLREAHKGDIEK